MDQGTALQLARQGMQVALMVSLPVLAVTLFMGLAVSVFQAVTQIQEITLTFVPKLLAVALVIAFMGNWMLTSLVAFTQLCFQQVAGIAG